MNNLRQWDTKNQVWVAASDEEVKRVVDSFNWTSILVVSQDPQVLESYKKLVSNMTDWPTNGPINFSFDENGCLVKVSSREINNWGQ